MGRIEGLALPAEQEQKVPEEIAEPGAPGSPHGRAPLSRDRTGAPPGSPRAPNSPKFEAVEVPALAPGAEHFPEDFL